MEGWTGLAQLSCAQTSGCNRFSSRGIWALCLVAPGCVSFLFPACVHHHPHLWMCILVTQQEHICIWLHGSEQLTYMLIWLDMCVTWKKQPDLQPDICVCLVIQLDTSGLCFRTQHSSTLPCPDAEWTWVLYDGGGQDGKGNKWLIIWIRWSHGLEQDFWLQISHFFCWMWMWSVFLYLWCGQCISSSLGSQTVLSKCNCFYLEAVSKKKEDKP